MEQYFIRKYKDNGITLYNLSDGGGKIYDWTGTHKSKEWKRKMSEIQKNVVFSPERGVGILALEGRNLYFNIHYKVNL